MRVKNPRVRKKAATVILKAIAPSYIPVLKKKDLNTDWILIKGPIKNQFILVAIHNNKIVFRELLEDLSEFVDIIPSSVYRNVQDYKREKKL